MTVAELIKELEKMPQDSIIIAGYKYLTNLDIMIYNDELTNETYLELY